jgi:hypothetical protein
MGRLYPRIVTIAELFHPQFSPYVSKAKTNIKTQRKTMKATKGKITGLRISGTAGKDNCASGQTGEQGRHLSAPYSPGLCLRTLATLLGAALLPCGASAQTWQTVDDFALNRGAVATGLALDPFGNIFAAGLGMTTNSGDWPAIVRQSSDAGATWQTVDVLSNARYGGWAAVPNGASLASDSVGNLYGVGAGEGQTWFTARSTDHGATWTNVEEFPNGWAIGVAADSAGNVYAVGHSNITWVTTAKNGSTTTNSSYNWMVRKGINAGSSWSTVDEPFPANVSSVPSAVLCHPTYGVFVTGQSNGYAITRRSINAGATWSTVDNAGAGTGFGLGADALGNLYVVGNTSAGQWLVRRSSDGGNSWLTVDSYQVCVTTTVTNLHPYRISTSTTCYGASANSFAADAYGNLFVVGSANTANGQCWVVRENPGGNSSWQTVDMFQYTPSAENRAHAVATDASGHVYVAGEAWITGDGLLSHWIVRKR